MSLLSSIVSVIASAIQIILYPFALVLGWVLIALSPVWHLLRLTLHALRLPLRIIASFEPVYVYLGTAVVVGIIVGSMLHLTSTTLISAFDLRPSADDELKKPRRPAARSRDGRGAQPLKAHLPLDAARPNVVDSRFRPYGDRHELGRTPQKGGLLSQTILEEEDNSDEVS